MRKQLTPLDIWQSDRSTAIKLNERTPRYRLFYHRSSPSDVNSPSYSAIRCWKLRLFFRIWYALKVPLFVGGERYHAVLLIVRRPYIWERTVQISAESNRRVPSKTVRMLGNLRTPEYEETTHSLRNLAKRSLDGY